MFRSDSLLDRERERAGGVIEQLRQASPAQHILWAEELTGIGLNHLNTSMANVEATVFFAAANTLLNLAHARLNLEETGEASKGNDPAVP